MPRILLYSRHYLYTIWNLNKQASLHSLVMLRKEKLIVIYSYIQTYYIMLFFIASSMNHKIVLCFLPGDISMFNKLVENVRI